jgi:hypothetical protein
MPGTGNPAYQAEYNKVQSFKFGYDLQRYWAVSTHTKGKAYVSHCYFAPAAL